MIKGVYLILYDEIVQALTDLGGEAKVEDLRRRILENNPGKRRSKNTIYGTLRCYQFPQKGKEYLFVPTGRGRWRLDRVDQLSDGVGKDMKSIETILMSGRGRGVPVTADDLSPLIKEAIEPLKKEGGQLSIYIRVVYRPEKK